jgi:hypothetical protein
MAALALATLPVPLSAGDQCASPASLSPRPAWIKSAIWVSPPVSRVLVVDSALNRLVLYGSDGKGRILTDKLLPGLLALSGDRILLKLVGMNAQSFDAKTLEDFRPHAVLKEIKTPLGPLAAVYQWLGVDHSLLATGLVLNDKLPKGFQPGLFRFSAVEENSKTAELVKTIDAWDYYVLGYQYLTSSGGSTGYFLDMDGGSARLFEIPLGGAVRELTKAMPPEAVKVPAVNATLNGPRDAPPLFEYLARQQMATGIYGGPDGNIYLLVRVPAANGINDWWLFRISVKGDGAVLGKAHLPSHAQHLSIVVSPETFYLFERGAVNPYGGQDIETMIAVPASVLERAPLRGINVCLATRR